MSDQRVAIGQIWSDFGLCPAVGFGITKWDGIGVRIVGDFRVAEVNLYASLCCAAAKI